jgi:putative FmdB family regulatory protein
MPTYEYECKSCGHTFEAFQSMREPPLKTCPQCGKEVRRLINGGSGIIFKGSGFYVTDKKSGSTAASPVKPGKPGEAASSTATASTGTSTEASAGEKTEKQEKKEKKIPEKALEKKAAG